MAHVPLCDWLCISLISGHTRHLSLSVKRALVKARAPGQTHYKHTIDYKLHFLDAHTHKQRLPLWQPLSAPGRVT